MLSHKKHRKRLLGGTPITKTKFCSLSKAPSNSQEFTIFFNKLKEEGVVIEIEEGKYLIEPSKAMNKIKSYPQGKIIRSVCREYELFGLK